LRLSRDVPLVCPFTDGAETDTLDDNGITAGETKEIKEFEFVV